MSIDTHDGYSGKRTAEIVGITYRQLDYWARTDLIRPSMADATGSGSRRRYLYRDLLELKIVKQLLDAGIKLENVRDVFSELRRMVGEEIAAANIVITGSTVALATDDGELIDLLKRGQGVLNVLNVGRCQADLDSRIVELRDESPAVAHPATAVH